MNFGLFCRYAFKALRLLWPYLRAAIFKDRTVVEVIRENMHFTCMSVLIMMLVFALSISVIRISELKEERAARKTTLGEVPCTCTTTFERNRFDELLKEE